MQTGREDAPRATDEIAHVNEVNLRIHVTEIDSGVKARLAAYGMKWGYDAPLDKLDALRSSPRKET